MAFDGDCSAVLAEDALQQMLGEGAVVDRDLPESARAIFAAEAERSVGALSCGWTDASGVRQVSATMAPTSIVAEDQLAQAEPIACADDGFGAIVCSVDVVVGDAWLALTSNDEEALAQALPVVGEALVDQHPTPATRPSDAWAKPTCAALDTVASSAFDSTVVDGFPSDDLPSGPRHELLEHDGAVTFCGMTGLGAANEIARVFVYSGVDAAAVPITLPRVDIIGADAGYGDAAGEHVAVVGSNAIVVEASASVARPLLEALIPAQTPRPATPTAEETE